MGSLKERIKRIHELRCHQTDTSYTTDLVIEAIKAELTGRIRADVLEELLK